MILRPISTIDHRTIPSLTSISPALTSCGSSPQLRVKSCGQTQASSASGLAMLPTQLQAPSASYSHTLHFTHRDKGPGLTGMRDGYREKGGIWNFCNEVGAY